MDTRDLVVPFDTKDVSQTVLLQHFKAFHVGSGDGPGLAAVKQGLEDQGHVHSKLGLQPHLLVGEHRRALRVKAKPMYLGVLFETPDIGRTTVVRTGFFCFYSSGLC